MLEAFFAWNGWYILTGVASVVGLFACLLFVVRFQVETGGAWWRNPFGRFLFFRKVLLAVLFTLALTNRFAPGWDAQRFVTAVLFTAFAVQTFVPYRLLLRAQSEIDKQEATQ